MRRYLNWAREIQWLNVLAIFFIVLAIVVAFVAIVATEWFVLALVFGFSAVALAIIGLR